MRQRALLLCWIAVGASVTETLYAVPETVTMLSSKGGEKLVIEVKPPPSAEVEVRVSVTDPRGGTQTLPPQRSSADPTGRVVGPALSVESRGFLIRVEVVDPATGASLGVNWGVVG